MSDDLEFEHFKLEYEQLCESYGHTYETIWSAGALFTGISGGLVVFGAREGAASLTDVARCIWALLFLVWWLGVFLPMDWYGRLRRRRLVELEKVEHLRHFSYITEAENSRPLYIRHVHHIVNVFGIGLVILWLALIPWDVVYHLITAGAGALVRKL